LSICSPASMLVCKIAVICPVHRTGDGDESTLKI
jgi:hypothetical protein